MAIATNRIGHVFLSFDRIKENELNRDNYQPLTHSLIVVKHDHGFLLVYDRLGEYWELPGGAIEEGESTRDCVVRELLEETNQITDDITFEGVMEFRMAPNGRIEFGALYSGHQSRVSPFQPNEEVDRIIYWDRKADIGGYIDEIDKAIIGLVRLREKGQ